MMNLRQLACGLLSYTPIPYRRLEGGTRGSDRAEYCYSVWLRHLSCAMGGGMGPMPATVAEIGPGDSIGVGLAALIGGAQQYVAFDAVAHADIQRNLVIFDELVERYRRRAAIPADFTYSGIRPALPDYAFPHRIYTEDLLAEALTKDRLTQLRAAVAQPGSRPDIIRYVAPWRGGDTPASGSIDLLVTQAVLEHVEGLPEIYQAMHAWLKPGGYASHQIDFRSHGLYTHWDGHWSVPEWAWRLMRGRRPYLINRQPCSVHIATAISAGLTVVEVQREDCAPCSPVSARHVHLSTLDRRTCGAYLLLRKPHKRDVQRFA